MAASRTLEIDAVNTILSTVGEPPVSTLDDALQSDASIAQNTLTEVSREVQTQGWHFNTVREVVLTPDGADSDRIKVADNVVRVDLERQHAGSYDIVQRGSYLYDRKGQTDAFSGNLKATVMYVLDWDELPEPARRYITIRAARIFQDRFVGSGEHHGFNTMDEFRALAILKEFESNTSDHSIFDNYDVYRVVDRNSVINRVGR